MTPIARDLTDATPTGLPDPALLAAITAHRSGGGELDAVYAALLESTLYAPAVAMPDSRGLALVALQRSDGATAVAAFTGIDALLSWRPDSRPLPRQGRELAHIAVTEGYAALVIDPGAELSMVIPAGPLAALAAGVIPAPRRELRPLDPADPVLSRALRAALAVVLAASSADTAYAIELGSIDGGFAPAVGVLGADGSLGDRLVSELARSADPDALPAGFALVALDDEQAAILVTAYPPLWQR